MSKKRITNLVKDDMCHNNFNYGNKPTDEENKEYMNIRQLFVDSFEVCDWFDYQITSDVSRCNIEFPRTWNKILLSLYKELLPYNKVITIEQIKEKFNGLRVYYSHNKDYDTKEIDKVIEKHEKMVEKLYDDTNN